MGVRESELTFHERYYRTERNSAGIYGRADRWEKDTAVCGRRRQADIGNDGQSVSCGLTAPAKIQRIFATPPGEGNTSERMINQYGDLVFLEFK